MNRQFRSRAGFNPPHACRLVGLRGCFGERRRKVTCQAEWRRARRRRDWLQTLLVALTLTAVGIMAIGMSWPMTFGTGQRAELAAQVHRMSNDNSRVESVGGSALGWLATDTATAVVTPVATDTATVSAPSPDTPVPVRPRASDQGSPTSDQATPTVTATALAPTAQPTTVDVGAPVPAQSTLGAPTEATTGSQALPAATVGTELTGSHGQAESTPVATGTQPAGELSGTRQLLTPSPGLSVSPAWPPGQGTGSPQGNPTPPALSATRLIGTLALVPVLTTSLWVAFVLWRRRTRQ